jgi:pimeloyl-ACP methyl ester carboxylesterase
MEQTEHAVNTLPAVNTLIRSSTLEANGVVFSYLHTETVNDTDRPLALCLHGFPDTAQSWRYLLPELDAAGFRPVAPFTRGYSPTEIASDGCYQTGALSADANALHEALSGRQDAVIIGHDWGAPSAYGAANHEPERWGRVVGMSVMPGGVVASAFLDPVQLKRSWYMFFFQHALADMVVPMNDLAFIDMLWADWSPGYDAAVDLEHVKQALRDPAHLSAALGYYRAAIGTGNRNPAYDAIQLATGRPIAQPTLYLHGADDGCIGAEFAALVPGVLAHADSRVEVVANAGHFLQLEQPRAVNDLILSFLTA